MPPIEDQEPRTSDGNRPKQQVLARLKSANNVLVTVSSNPSVDQLAGAIGLTLLLNKQGKHATAVFSGEVPPVISFLQPEKTLEKTTDSLRDFIISLDKSKADKLRYKVEDKVVKIFITPYKTSLSEKDLEFSQGDFNVDVVMALGVHERSELDQAITAHGRILHDATVISVNNHEAAELGSIHWLDQGASSLCEMLTLLADDLQKDLLDEQIATALLTGIVAETDRFRNAKTTPQSLEVSGMLMSAGANQQLVTAKLDQPAPPVPEGGDEASGSAGTPAAPNPPKPDDGTLEIKHDEPESMTPGSADTEPPADNIRIDEDGGIHTVAPSAPQPAGTEESKQEPAPASEPEAEVEDEEDDDEQFRFGDVPGRPPQLVLQPPTLGGTLTASYATGAVPSIDPMNPSNTDGQLLNRKPLPTKAPTLQPLTLDEQSKQSEPASAPPQTEEPKPLPQQVVDYSNETLANIEKEVQSPHLDTPLGQGLPTAEPAAVPTVEDARAAVENIIAETAADLPERPAAFNAMPLGPELHPAEPSQPAPQVIAPEPAPPVPPSQPPAPQPAEPVEQAMQWPSFVPQNSAPVPAVTNAQAAPSAPPPIPPPMMPPAS